MLHIGKSKLLGRLIEKEGWQLEAFRSLRSWRSPRDDAEENRLFAVSRSSTGLPVIAMPWSTWKVCLAGVCTWIRATDQLMGQWVRRPGNVRRIEVVPRKDRPFRPHKRMKGFFIVCHILQVERDMRLVPGLFKSGKVYAWYLQKD